MNSSNRIFFSGYFGGDDFTLKDISNELKETWGNAAYAIRLNSIWSSSFFTNLTFVFSEYRNTYREMSQQSSVEKKPNVNDKMVKVDATYTLSSSSYVSAGLSLVDHRFGVFSGFQETETNQAVILDAVETNAFVSLDWDIIQNIRLTSGARFTSFGSGNYKAIEPRMSVMAGLSRSLSLRMSYDRFYQFIHSLSSFSLMSPGELYYPSTGFLQPEIGNQTSVGVTVLPEDPFDEDARLNISIEGYYKEMENLPQIKYRFSSVDPASLEKEILLGKGRSYGLELNLERTDKIYHLWVNYTWSRALREFPEKNRGNEFPASFQREHNLNITADGRGWESWAIAATFVIASGAPTTLPKGRFSLNGSFPNSNFYGIIDYGDLNTNTLPVYNRLDVGVNYTFPWLGGIWKLQLNVYNVYGYPNPLFNYFDVQSGKLEQVSIGTLPTFGVTFSF